MNDILKYYWHLFILTHMNEQAERNYRDKEYLYNKSSSSSTTNTAKYFCTKIFLKLGFFYPNPCPRQLFLLHLNHNNIHCSFDHLSSITEYKYEISIADLKTGKERINLQISLSFKLIQS